MLNSQRCHHGWHQVEKFAKFVPTDTLKMHPLGSCLFLDFFVKHSPNYLTLHYKKLFFVDDFKKIQIFILKICKVIS